MEENQNNVVYKNNNGPYIVIIILLVIIAILAFFVGANFSGNLNMMRGDKSSEISQTANTSDVVVKVIGDKRCTNCSTNDILAGLKSATYLNGAKFEEIDFSDKGAEKLMKENDIKYLPAFLFNTNNINSNDGLTSYLTGTKAGMFSLLIGANFDPYAEVCGNNIDDNKDGKTDCEDPACMSSDYTCKKVDKPVADLYIMSHCPYGLQAQKGYLEVMSKLGKVADVNVKWVPYIMHGQKEADENVVQYCIQKEQKETYTKYLNCFLAGEGKEEICKKEAGIDTKKLDNCVAETKKEYKVDENMKNTTSRYPEFSIDKEEAIKAGVEGSPTFVLNGVKIDNMGRNAKAYADAICSTFKDKPEECMQDFQTVNFDPMFGFTTGGGANSADSGCAPQ